MNKINAELWTFPQAPEGYFYSDYIQHVIIDYIKTGVLKPGDQLPSQQAFATHNGKQRTTILRIYRRLEKKGWIELRAGSGSYVSQQFPDYNMFYPASRVVKQLPVKLPVITAEEVRASKPFQDFTTIGLDTPNLHYLPIEDYAKHIAKHAKMAKTNNQMDRIKDLRGTDFKTAILDYLNVRRNFMVSLACLEVITGRSESLKQVLKMLLRPGNAVVNTSPKDIQLSKLLKDRQAEVHILSAIEDDFIARLKQLLDHVVIKALYIRPQCSFPENRSLSSYTCESLLELAKQYKFYIIEEDDYHEFWYKKIPFKPLICYDHQGHVIYCGALSLLSAYTQQIRTVVAATEFIALMKQNGIKQSPFRELLFEKATTDLLNNNKFWHNVKKVQSEKSQHAFEIWMEMKNALGEILNVPLPSAGLSMWLVFKDDSSLLQAMTYLEEKGYQIPYHPDGQLPGPGVTAIRLGFGTWDVMEAQTPGKQLFEKFGLHGNKHQ